MSATISDCGTYRYTLHRDLGGLLGAGVCLFVMLNPSTADASQDDPTIRRCKAFADRWGHAELTVANLYAYRATSPAALDEAADPVGPHNDDWIDRLATAATRIVCAWGADVGPIAYRAEQVTDRLSGFCELEALGLAANGEPRHPLYVRGDAELIEFGGGW